jgi:hypothetical protein
MFYLNFFMVSYLFHVSSIQCFRFFFPICFHNFSYLVFSSFFFLSFQTHGRSIQYENINHKKICGHSV